MNRRGFLAGVMGLCAGLPLVNKAVGPVAGVINALIPIQNDLLVFAGENSVMLIGTSDGQITICGQSDDPQNWYMSALNDPTDWDYSPGTTVKTASTSTDGVTIDWFRG